MQTEPDQEAGGTEAEVEGQDIAPVSFLAGLEVDRSNSMRRFSGSGPPDNVY